MARKNKAAFQLSLGLIVAVVFAVILLSLSITWIQQMMGSLTEITHKVTDVARDNLMKELASTGRKVGIAAPAVSEWKKAETGSYAIGIRNNDDVRRKTFYIGVYLNNPNPSISSAEETVKWFEFSESKIIDAGGRDTIDLIIRPEPGSKTGIYLFRVVVCTDGSPCDKNDYRDDNDFLHGSEEFALDILES